MGGRCRDTFRHRTRLWPLNECPINYISTMQIFNFLELCRVRVVFAFALLALPALGVQALPGNLDPSFGAGTGKALIGLGFQINHELDSALQPDGKAIVMSYCGTNGSVVAPMRTCIFRIDTSGNLDVGFGNLGVFRAGPTQCAAYGSLRLLPSGKIMIAGTYYPFGGPSNFCLMQLNSDGTIDSTFGNSGVITLQAPLPVESNGPSVDVSVLSDGKMLLSGSCRINGLTPAQNEVKFCISRVYADGSLDTTFGNAGFHIVSGGAMFNFLSTTTYSTTGIYLTGSCSDDLYGYPTSSFCVTRVTLEGVTDSSWGAQGWARAQLLGLPITAANELVLGADGNATVTAHCGASEVSTLGCLVRLSAAGMFDPAFGNGGVLIDSASYPVSRFSSITQSLDGRSFFVAGACGESIQANSPCVWKIFGDGTTDAGFGTGGTVQISFPQSTTAYGRRSVHQQSNGRLVFAGTCLNATGQDACLAKLVTEHSYFDLDDDSLAQVESDGVLFLRYLIGFRGPGLTADAVGPYAKRNASANIASYLSTTSPIHPNCGADIVGAPGGANAMLDGIVLMRVMFGLTGEAVTNGINFPLGTMRTTWSDIKSHLSTDCGMVLN